MSQCRAEGPIIFLWDNFGPLHVDRCDALSKSIPTREIIGLEMFAKSSDYSWKSENGSLFRKITIQQRIGGNHWSIFSILRTIISNKPHAIFFCHYQRYEIAISALFCRLIGIKVFTMNDSKFDDYSRNLIKELMKSLFFRPYHGALVASRRTSEYLQFLGIKKTNIFEGYDAVSVDRIRHLAGSHTAPLEMSFDDRHFTIVARLIPKKNISLALKAFSKLVFSGCSRKLVVCGDGPLESELKILAINLGIESRVEFRGFIQTAEVCRVLSSTLALILPSTEEQFGQVIPEALAMGVPVLVSENCGARDYLVKSGVNGFIFEPTNVDGLFYFMSLINTDRDLWQGMAKAALQSSRRGDVENFVNGVKGLIGEVVADSEPPHNWN